MAKFLIRRLFSLILTMFVVSAVVYIITEASPGNIARNVLGAYVTAEQEASFLAQAGLDKPLYTRYLYWVLGSDWHASQLIGMPMKRILTEGGFEEWWAVREDGSLIRWRIKGDDLIAIIRNEDGTTTEELDNSRWREDKKEDNAIHTFWGVDKNNHAVKWERNTEKKSWTFYISTGWISSTGAPTEYIPLKKGIVRGDPFLWRDADRQLLRFSKYVLFRVSMIISKNFR